MKLKSRLSGNLYKLGLKPINPESNTHAINGVAIDNNCLGKTLSIHIEKIHELLRILHKNLILSYLTFRYRLRCLPIPYDWV